MSGMKLTLSAKRPIVVAGRPLAAKKDAPKPPAVQEVFGGAGSDDEDARPGKASELAKSLDASTADVATKLADFVAKNGDAFEGLTREKNSADGPFGFLHNKSSLGYRYYSAKLAELKGSSGAGAGAGVGGAAGAPPLPPPPASAPPPPPPSQPGPSSTGGNRFGPPPPAPYSQAGPSGRPHAASPPPSAPPSSSAYSALPQGNPHSHSSSPAPQQPPPAGLTEEALAEARRRAQIAFAKGDSVAAMEAFAAMAASRDRGRSASADPEDEDEEQRRRKAEPLLNKTAFERRKTTAVYKDDGTRGHHMGDYIPKEVLAEFLAKQGDKVAQAQVQVNANKNAIGADNIGHKLLQKMGWKEGEALGGTQKGITAPIKATAAAAPGEARGLGAAAHGEVTAEDDPFEAYRKRMMLGYKYRPNPLGNPRKAYY